jgi:hypothetical protein
MSGDGTDPIDVPRGYSAFALRMDLPGNLYFLAEQYLIAAVAIADAAPTPGPGRVMTGLPSAPQAKGSVAPIPMYFCIAHAAELFLKSYLSAKGERRDTVPGWTMHNIGDLLKTTIERGLVLDELSQKIVSDIGSQNEKFQLRFQEDTLPLVLPPAGKSIEAIRRLADGVLLTVRPHFRVRE